jgi:hypothetical protein
MQLCCLHSEQVDSQGVKGQDSKEAFEGEKTNISHFWAFGCLVYIHVPKGKGQSLNPPNKGIHVGYSDTKAYKIYVLSQ